MKAAPQLLALQRQRPGAFTALIAATCLLMLLAAALVLALRAAARVAADAAAGRVVVQVVDPDPARRDAVAAEVMARLGRTPGVASSHRVPDHEARALVDPYIAGMPAADLPLPILIEARAERPSAVRQALASLPTVAVTIAGGEVGPLLRLMDALCGVALGVALTAAVATGLIATLSARAALAREGATLAILHALGATDRQLSRLVTATIARDAAIGAAIGLTAAMIVILAIARQLAATGVGLDPRPGFGGWAILASLALALVGLATAVAHGALLATLRRAP